VRPVPARGAGVDVVVDAGGDVARRALPALAVVSFVFFASSGIQLPLLSIAMANVGVSPSSIGAMWAARSLAAAVAPIGWGLVADRLGNARPLLVASLAAGGALMLWLATAPSTAVCIAIFALYGALTGPAGSMIDGMTLTALGARRAHFGRWRAVGTVGFGTSAVVVAVLLEGGWLAPRPESLFPLCAALLFLGAIVAGLAVPRLARPALQDPRLLLVAFRQPLLRGLMLLGLLLWCSHGAWAGFLSVMVERAGLLPRVVGLAVVASVVVEAAMMAWSARLIDRFGASRILVACAGLAVVRWVTSMLPLSATAFVLVHSLHGVTFGLFFIVMVTLLAERCPPELRQASQGTLSSVVFGIGGLFGGTLCGQMLQAHADPAWAWGAMAAVGVVAVVVTLVVVRRLPRTTAS
jgi:MFS family permease